MFKGMCFWEKTAAILAALTWGYLAFTITTIMVATLSGCNTGEIQKVPRPDTDLCGVNVKGVVKKKRCYNLARDYDENGNLLPTAKPTETKLEKLEDLHGNICLDPRSWGNFKAYLRILRGEHDGGRRGD